MGLRILAAAALLSLHATFAVAAGWIVEQVNQPARYTQDGGTWNVLERGMALPNAVWVHTGNRGRLLLRREAETLIFKRNTLAAVTDPRGDGARTMIRQTIGTLLVDVNTRDVPHTSVETPFLAAVVKGTRFEVQVSERSAAVRVRRGIVQVTDIANGLRADVRGRQSVTVAADRVEPLRVRGFGAKAPVVRVAPGEAVVLGAADATRAASVRGDAPTSSARNARGGDDNVSENSSRDSDRGTGKSDEVKKPGKDKDDEKPGKDKDDEKPGKDKGDKKPGKDKDDKKPGKDKGDKKPGKDKDEGPEFDEDTDDDD